MRRLSLILLCALIAAPAALAAAHSTGDGVLELKDVNASKLTINGVRGVIWGQLDFGTLKVTDPNPDDNLVALVSGAERTRTTDDPGVTIYSGKNIHFRFTGGKYRFALIGSGIDLTAVGVGQAYVTGDPYAADDGDYAVDGTKWQSVPLLKKTLLFGQQPLPSIGP
jgi:hypothetical protein